MAYLHSCRVVHRDIKPQNILIDDRPDSPTYLHVRIADFGLSRAVELPPGTLPTPPPSPSGASALPSPRLIRKSQSEANFLAGISNCEFRTVFGEDGDHACVELGLERLALADDFQRNGSEPMCVRMLCALELSQVKRASLFDDQIRADDGACRHAAVQSARSNPVCRQLQPGSL
jgi:serine/threonine protein kinase